MCCWDHFFFGRGGDISSSPLISWAGSLVFFGDRGIFRPCRIPKLNHKSPLGRFCGVSRRCSFGRTVPVAPAGGGRGSPRLLGLCLPGSGPVASAASPDPRGAADGGRAGGGGGVTDTGSGDSPGRAGWGVGALGPPEWGQWRRAIPKLEDP